MLDTAGALFSSAAGGNGRISVVSRSGETRTTSWKELYEVASAAAGALIEDGVAAGSRVGIFAGSSLDTVAGIQAVLLSGASLTMLPPPSRGTSGEAWTGVLSRTVDLLGLDLVLHDNASVSVPFGSRGSLRTLELARLFASPKKGPSLVIEQDPDSPALLQLTSGSTGDVKAAVISHRNLTSNIAATRTASGHESIHGSMVSWLPLYHDMGLIGFLLIPMACGECRLTLTDPQRFLARPRSWIEDLAELGATATAGPNFAYSLVTPLLRSQEQTDLSNLRFVLCGGERIQPGTIRGFYEAGRRHGLDPSSFVAAYGLAEATLAVSMRLGPLATESVPRVGGELEPQMGGEEPASLSAEVCRLGQPLTSVEVRVVSDDGDAAPEREVGTIYVAGDSVSSLVLQDGELLRREDKWVDTGDLGYTTKGELVICGRKKDTIILAGQNVYPEDIEAVVSLVPGVKAGTAVAVPIRIGATEGIRVILERSGVDDDRVVEEVRRAVRSATGHNVSRITIAAPGTVPKTSSGKIQRTRAAALLE